MAKKLQLALYNYKIHLILVVLNVNQICTFFHNLLKNLVQQYINIHQFEQNLQNLAYQQLNNRNA